MITDYGVKALIGARLRAKPTPMSDLVDAIAPNVPSSLPAGQAERLDFLGAVPAMRKWVDGRKAKQVLQQLHTAKLEKYEASVQIPGDLLRNDKTGQVSEIAGGLANGYRRWKTRLLCALLSDGAATTLGACFDGKALFANDHAWNGQTYDNLLTQAAATGTSPTANEAAEAIVTCIQTLYGFVDDQGEPINEDMSALTIIVSPTIGGAVKQAVEEQNLDTGTGVRTNPVRGWANALKLNVIITPRYTDTDAIAVVRSDEGAAPVVFVENGAERMVTSKPMGGEFAHDNDAAEYGVQAVGVAACGRFTDAVQMTFT